MKKLLCILLTIITIQSNAVNLVIVNSSFNTTDSICPNSQHWVDAIVQGTWSSSDLIRIFLNGQSSSYQILLNVNFQNYYFALPINSDSSRRIYFNMPTNPPSISFDISLNLGNQVYGVFYQSCISTAINESLKSVPILTDIIYYNLQGQKVIPTEEGIYIKQEGDIRKKVYISMPK